MRVRPLGNRIVVEAEKVDEVSQGGIFIPDAAVDEPRKGVVTGAGPEADVEEGDVILFAKKAGIDVEVEGVPVLILTSEDILAVVE